MDKSLTIIIPTFNEEDGIKETLCELLPVCEQKKWNIIVINDGSTDSTCKELNSVDGIKVINHPYNKGYGASLKTGVKAADTELIAFYDADCFASAGNGVMRFLFLTKYEPITEEALWPAKSDLLIHRK